MLTRDTGTKPQPPLPPGLTVAGIGEVMVELAPVGGGLYRRGFAGDTFNTVWHMAQVLGPQATVGFVTCVGQDHLSQDFVAEAAADGLATAGIARSADRTLGLYLIELDGVERSFHYWRSQSAARTLADDPAALALAVGQAGLIHLSGITLAILPAPARAALIGVLARARAAGAVISFDPNIRPRLWSSAEEARAAVAAVLAVTDIALPSFDDEAALWGDADPQATQARCAAAGVAEVIVKTGAGPVEYLAAGQPGTQPTPPAPDIRDTTGAGDAFNAGYLAARLRGRAVPAAIGMGQSMAAAVLACHGARADRAQVRALRARLG